MLKKTLLVLVAALGLSLFGAVAANAMSIPDPPGPCADCTPNDPPPCVSANDCGGNDGGDGPCPTWENCGPPPCTDDCGPPPCTDDCGPPPCADDCGPPPGGPCVGDCDEPDPCVDDCVPPPCVGDCAPPGSGCIGDCDSPQVEAAEKVCNTALGKLRKVTVAQIEAYTEEDGVRVVPLCERTAEMQADADIDPSQAIHLRTAIDANDALTQPLAERDYVADDVVGVVMMDEAAILYVHKGA